MSPVVVCRPRVGRSQGGPEARSARQDAPRSVRRCEVEPLSLSDLFPNHEHRSMVALVEAAALAHLAGSGLGLGADLDRFHRNVAVLAAAIGDDYPAPFSLVRHDAALKRLDALAGGEELPSEADATVRVLFAEAGFALGVATALRFFGDATRPRQ